MQVEFFAWLCQDCLFAAVNGDSPQDETRDAEVTRGLESLGPHLVPAFDSETGEGIYEHSICRCGCCQDRAHGSRHRFAVLGE